MFKTVAIFTLLIISSGVGYCHSEIDSLLNVLDKTMESAGTYMHQKENRLKSLYALLETKQQSPEQHYAINSLLYKEYLKFKFDSALHYMNKNLELAESMKRTDLINESRFALSRIFSGSGMYFEALDVLKQVRKQDLNPGLLVDYYSCMQQLYAELGLYSALPANAEKYNILSFAYRDTLVANLDPKSSESLRWQAAILQDKGDFEQSRKINSRLIAGVKEGSEDYALYAFLRAISYRIQGNTVDEEKYLIKSAISDIKNAVKDNVSLTLLAVLLYEKNDIDLAYRYIMYSLEDAKFYNSRLRYVEISKILPLISESFRLKNEKQQRQLRLYALVITLLAVSLIIASVFLYSQMKRLSKARQSLQEANQTMQKLHEDLIRVNAQLKSLNHELLESNRTKEEHIGFFLNLCSTYIDKLDDFRKFVHRKVTSGQYEDLFKVTKSNHYFDSELKEFYSNFDNTFLHLFPNFVEQFNALLLENERIEIKNDELLTTELRIFALIRLGVTDSSKIASFLRYSVNTIYNYRTRIRNKALMPRDDFERKVKTIGVF
jgi:tetratricopeptide (TPR) repeat protein